MTGMGGFPGFQGLPSIFAGSQAMSLFPSVGEVETGLEMLRSGKEPFKVKAYRVEVFDMSAEKDRKAYCALMERLMPLCQTAGCLVVKNDLQSSQGPSGVAWHRYVEWFEYSLNRPDSPAVQPAPKASGVPGDDSSDGGRPDEFDGFGDF